MTMARTRWRSGCSARRSFANSARSCSLSSTATSDGSARPWLTRGAPRCGSSAEQRLRHLPWELVARDGSFLAVSEARAAAAGPGRELDRDPRCCRSRLDNRPLRVLFMATSPEGVEPVLSYEAEEAAILAATARHRHRAGRRGERDAGGAAFHGRVYGAGYFDVLHLSGHATIA